MEAQHARVVHLVDVIARQHDEVARILADDRVEVLVHRVGRALVPVLAHPLLRRQNLDELTELLRHDVPAHPDVAVERERLVLRGDEDAAQAGVDAVAQGEIDDPVRAAEVDRRLGPILGKRIQALAGTTGEHDDEAVVEERGHGRSAVTTRRRTWHPMRHGSRRPQWSEAASWIGGNVGGLHGPPAPG